MRAAALPVDQSVTADVTTFYPLVYFTPSLLLL